jgi:3-oxoacyl-[acyl-carrier-protein] synthase I
LLIQSVSDALKLVSVDPADPRTIFIISSTKGNISYIETNEITDDAAEKVSLSNSALVVSKHFNNPNKPVVVSNACISGVLALLTAKRMIDCELYDHAVVTGADLITKFILSGFQSFQAVSPEPCTPFDKKRQGVTLGEGAATMILSNDPSKGKHPVRVMGGATSNDANHISGPSRTGEPLSVAIRKSMREAGVTKEDIDFIVAHGTATIFNDDMESKAITLAGLNQVPVNSLKGFYGHTLGAAGLIESAIGVESIRSSVMIPTKGFREPGVAEEINICSTLKQAPVSFVLKTASGFGGCNAAMVFGKQ